MSTESVLPQKHIRVCLSHIPPSSWETLAPPMPSKSAPHLWLCPVSPPDNPTRRGHAVYSRQSCHHWANSIVPAKHDPQHEIYRPNLQIGPLWLSSV